MRRAIAAVTCALCLAAATASGLSPGRFGQAAASFPPGAPPSLTHALTLRVQVGPPLEMGIRPRS